MRKINWLVLLVLAILTPSIPVPASAAEVVFEKDASLPLVFLNVAIKTGAVSDPVNQLGLTNFMGEMMLRGTTERNKEEIDLAIDQMGAQLEVETRSETMIFRGAVLASQLDPYLALLKEILTRPSFPQDEIANLKSEVESQILEEHSNDERLAGLAFTSFLFGDHPYGKPILGKVATVQKLTRKEIIAHYRDLISDDTILVVGSGDTTHEKISDLVHSLKAALPAHGIHPLPKIEEPENPSHKRLLIVDKPDRTQTQITGGQIGITMKDPNYFPIYLANEAFGGESFSSEMMHQIRVERGWSYGAYSYFKYAREPRSWQFYLFPAEKDTPDALAYTLAMIRGLKEHGITQKEFAFAKERLVNSAGFMYNTPMKRVENTLIERLLGLPEGFMKSYGPNLEKVTYGDANSSIQDFLRPDQLSIVVVGTAKDLKSKLAQAAGIPESQIEVVPYAQE